jgi:hypothetical protein
MEQWINEAAGTVVRVLSGVGVAVAIAIAIAWQGRLTRGRIVPRFSVAKGLLSYRRGEFQRALLLGEAIDIHRWAYMIDHLFPKSAAEHATDNLFDAGKLKAPRRWDLKGQPAPGYPHVLWKAKTKQNKKATWSDQLTLLQIRLSLPIHSPFITAKEKFKPIETK